MTRIYRLTLHLLPAELRRKHGAAMESLFRRELAAARERGRLAEIVAVITGLRDVIARSAYEVLRMGDAQLENAQVQIPTTRELLRRHALSFIIAFVALTAALLFLFATRQVPSLTARGDGFSTVGQMLLLALPFTAAMTIPMAVLVSVLYEFSRLGANGTLVAARNAHNGVRRLVAPVLAAAAGVTAVAFVVTAEIVPRANEQLATVLAGHITAQGDRSMTIGELREVARHVDAGTAPIARFQARSRAASLEVEIQKKFALPAACLALALAGMALAFRMPRGGEGFVILASLLLFAAYYSLIMTGEDLADRLVVSPFVGTWSANAFVIMVSLLALWRRRGPLKADGQEAVAVAVRF